ARPADRGGRCRPSRLRRGTRRRACLVHLLGAQPPPRRSAERFHRGAVPGDRRARRHRAPAVRAHGAAQRRAVGRGAGHGPGPRRRRLLALGRRYQARRPRPPRHPELRRPAAFDRMAAPGRLRRTALDPRRRGGAAAARCLARHPPATVVGRPTCAGPAWATSAPAWRHNAAVFRFASPRSTSLWTSHLAPAALPWLTAATFLVAWRQFPSPFHEYMSLLLELEFLALHSGGFIGLLVVWNPGRRLSR